MPFVRIEQAAALLDAGYNAFDCPGEVIGADRNGAAALPAALSSKPWAPPEPLRNNSHPL